MYVRTSQGFPAQFPPRSATKFAIFRVAVVSCGIRQCCSSVLRNSLLSHYCVAVVCCGLCHSIFLKCETFQQCETPRTWMCLKAICRSQKWVYLHSFPASFVAEVILIARHYEPTVPAGTQSKKNELQFSSNISYGVATISRLIKITGLFCRISSLR